MLPCPQMAKHPVVHFEIGCRELARTRDFYTKLFDWEFNDFFQVTEKTAGLGGHLTRLGHEPHNYTIFYVQVPDVAESIAKASSWPLPSPESNFATYFKSPDRNWLDAIAGEVFDELTMSSRISRSDVSRSSGLRATK